MSLRVLFVQSQTEVGGAETSLLALLGALDRDRVQPAVAVLGFGRGDLPERLRRASVEVFEFRAGRLRNPLAWVRTVRGLSRLARERGFGVLVANGYHPHLYSHPAARRSDALSFVFCHDLPAPRGRGPLAERISFRCRSDAYLVPSTFMAAAVRGRIHRPRPVYLVPHGVDPARFRPDERTASRLRAELALSEEHLVVTTAGRLTSGKGQHVFLQAAAKVAARVPRARFLVVGEELFGIEPGYPEKLRQMAADYGLSGRVTFTGGRRDMHAVYAASDVVVVPSLKPESFGMVVAEAMTSGCPVIASRAGGTSELFVEGVSGLGCAPGNAEEMAGKLLKLLGDSALRERIGDAARARATEGLSPQLAARALTDALLGPSGGITAGDRRLADERTVPGLSDPAIVALQEARYRTACGFVGPGMRVLDLACGVGNGSRLLMRTGAKVIGVDYDLPALRQGRRIFRKSPGRVVAANALRLPFPDGGFDAVVCFELIEHLKEQDALLGELCRVLRAGGRLLLSTPNRLTEKSLDAPGGPGVSPHHVKTLSPGELRGLLRRYFRSVRIRSFRRRGSRLYAVLRRLDVFNLRLKLGWRARESVARRLGAGAAERGWSARSFVLARGGLRQAINLLASCTAPTTTRQKRAGTAMIVSASYPPDRGGVSDHSALLAGYLAARGVSVRVCTTGGCGMVGPGEPGLLYLRDTWSVCGARRIAQAVAREAPACLVFQYVPHMYGRAGVALGAALFPWFSRIRRVPVITHFHEVCVPWSVHPLHFLQALVHRIQAVVMTAGSRGVVFANRRVAEIMKPWVRLLRRPCEVLPSGPTIPIVEVPGPRLAQVRSVWAHSGEALVVVYGLASRGKRYDLALRALAKLRAGGSPVRLLMLGDQEAGDARYCQEVREETRRMGLEAAVTWSGPLPAAEITEILASANCMWNLQSGGLTARNATAACAFAVGLPVVAFGGRLLDSCFRDGENVILAPADAEAFAAATQRLLSSPEVAAQLRRNGRALYEQSFSWRVIAGRYLELLAAMGVAVG